MIQAAVCHGFDFANYDPRVTTHRQKLEWYTEQIQRMNAARFAELEAQRHLAVYASRGFSEDSRSRGIDNYMEQRDVLRKAMFPGEVILAREDIMTAMEREYAEAVAAGEIRGGPAFEKKA
jgi:hypothetical protein